MPDKKKPIDDNQSKQENQRSLNDNLSAPSTGSQNFGKVERAKNGSGAGKIEYISKPKISSEDTNNIKKK